MTYFDLGYLFLFLPITLLLYVIVPKKIKCVVLLIASYVFFFLLSGKLLICLLGTTLLTYVAGLLINKIENKKSKALEKCEVDNKKKIKKKYDNKKRIILVLSILILLSSLVIYKYLPFFTTNINNLFHLNLNVIKFIAPIGISYYTLEAIAYLVDVYHSKIIADKNILKVALFLSFFPQTMEGPIARYTDTIDSLYNGNKVTYNNLTFGLQRILYGLMKKYIIADRVNPLVKEIFTNYMKYDGGMLILGVIGYTVMLYMEFSGTIDIVIGSAEIFGIKLPENFRQPFFSKNISEFWSRWHITLGTWFKDYIFYPVSLSKLSRKLTIKGRKLFGNHYGPLLAGSLALLCVWLSNGLWHGAGWNYVFFGIYHFVLILFGNLFEPLIKTVCEKIHINREKLIYRIMQSVKMTILVLFGEMFFRAPTVQQGFYMLNTIFTKFSFNGFMNGTYLKLGIDLHDYLIVIIFILFVFIVSLIKEKSINIREKVASYKIYIRWPIYYFMILSLLVFGAYGHNYEPVDPLYADF